MMALPFDIAAEHGRCDGLTDRDLAWLRDRGVAPGAVLKDALGHWSLMMRDRVTFSGTRFEFARHLDDAEAVNAFIIPGTDEFGDVADMIAWRPPSTMGTWLGRVGLVGEELVSAARFGEPLLIHADVLGWLRAGREGVVIVDPIRAACLLRSAGTLAVATVAERRKLETLLTVRAPRIEVVQSAQVAPIEAKVARETIHDNIMNCIPATPKAKQGTSAEYAIFIRTVDNVNDSDRPKQGNRDTVPVSSDAPSKSQRGTRNKLSNETIVYNVHGCKRVDTEYGIVDNINNSNEGRPTGTSKEAGLRTLQKHAEVAH